MLVTGPSERAWFTVLTAYVAATILVMTRQQFPAVLILGAFFSKLVATDGPQVEARSRLGQCRAAEQALAQAARREPAFARSLEFKSMQKQLRQLLQQQGACVG